MIIETIFIGILIGFIYYEHVGITPGGIITPGYIALYLDRPLVLASTLITVLLTYLLVSALSRMIILYGRRAFLAAVMIGFLLKFAFETFLFQMSALTYDLQVIGFIIPGLIASEMRKQGVVVTMLSVLLVSSIVYFIVHLLP